MNSVSEAVTTRGETSPAHVNRGLRRVLESPAIYAWFQRLLGAEPARRRFVEEFIRPFPGMRLLDVGCGPGVILDDLPANVDYVGCDLNDRYIRAAQTKHGARGRFFCADVTAAGALGPCAEEGFDVVLALALLHHLEDGTAERLCREAHGRLKPGGVLVTLDCVHVPGQPLVARYLISRDRGRAVRDPAGYLALTGRGFDPVESVVLTDLLRVPYTHFIMRAHKA